MSHIIYIIKHSLFNRKNIYILILFLVWLYRVDFIPAEVGGVFVAMQIGSILLILFIILLNNPSILNRIYLSYSQPLKGLLVFYFFGLVSISWSIMPFFSGFLAFQNIILIILWFWFLGKFPTFFTLEKAFIISALFIGYIEAIISRILFEHSLYIHFLSPGSISAIILSYSFAEYLRKNCGQYRKKFLIRSFFIALLLLVTSTSSGANISAAFGICIALLLSGQFMWAFFLSLFGIYLFLNQDLMNQLFLTIMPGKNMDMIESATGRSNLWKIQMELAQKRPLLGYGYACIERAASLTGDIKSPDAHNNYIGIYGSLGTVGIVIFFLFHFIPSILYPLKRLKRKGYVGLLSAICCASLNGYTYGFLSGKACAITVVYFQLIVLLYLYSKFDRNG